MKRILLTILAMLMISTCTYAFSDNSKANKLVTLPLFTSVSKAENTVWVGTFQLVWNDLMDDIVNGYVYLQDGNDEIVNGLNQQVFKASMLSPKSYYKTHGIMTTALRDTINTELLKKFNETSDLLKGVNWDGKTYLLYAMLKKDFKYPYNFDVLQPDKFGKSKSTVQYFGINEKSDIGLRGTVDVLFYNSKNDYAVMLNTNGKDVVMLYRTNEKLSLYDAYKQMLNKSFTYEGKKEFGKKDTLKIPYIKFKNDYVYDNLTNKKILGTDFIIGSAIQTIDFNMDNNGVKLKSEAAMMMRMSMRSQEEDETQRDFNFNENFYLFMQEGLNEPYFAMKIGDISGVNKY